QHINAFGGNKVQGKSEEAAKRILEAALAVQEAGAFSVTLECVPAKLAELITKQLEIPTIGIGAGSGCDGQILVYQDMLGMFSDYSPKFVKRFVDAGELMKKGFSEYIREVKKGSYPAEEHTFSIDDEILEKLY
ncbi:MAG: 3-methyl-2-oxobutanoate hydroxymethyltransferase, partial [Lachnospiraceae bacterium]|nr:3-methyl-2-oxobutanoate hydroxymethyltransferase [Lachnospiraceae bacterium]